MHNEIGAVADAIANVHGIFAAPLTTADWYHAQHTPCDKKFVADWVSCGTTRVWRHARRKLATGHVAQGCARLLLLPATGILAALTMAPAGLGFWVGRGVAHSRQARGIPRTAVGVHEDKIGTAVCHLRDTLAAFQPATQNDERLLMAVAGDARQVVWDLKYSLRANRGEAPRLFHSPLLRPAMRTAIRYADHIDDTRRATWTPEGSPPSP